MTTWGALVSVLLRTVRRERSGFRYADRPILARVFTLTLNVPVAAAGLLCCFVSITSNALPLLRGDIAPRGNPNGSIDLGDVVVLQRIVAGTVQPTPLESLLADVAPLGAPDGEINVADVLILMRVVLGSTELPAPSDSIPLLSADPNLISAVETAGGEAVVTGAPGSAEPGALVEIENLDTGDQTVVAVAQDGSFSANLAALNGQSLAIRVIDAGTNVSDYVVVGVGQIVHIQIESPASGSVLANDRVTVTGSVSGPQNIGVVVNGNVACVWDGRFYAVDVPLASGTTMVQTTATTLDSVAARTSIQLVSAGTQPIQMSVSAPCGFAPHDVSFNVVDNADVGIAAVSVDFNDDGIAEYSGPYISDNLTYRFDTVGIHHPQFTVTDGAGMVHSMTGTVVVKDPSATNAMLSATYDGLMSRLQAGAILGAVNHFSATTSAKYEDIFRGLGSGLSQAVDRLGACQSYTLGEDWAEFLITRPGATGTEAFLIYFVQGADGVWRLEEM